MKKYMIRITSLYFIYICSTFWTQTLSQYTFASVSSLPTKNKIQKTTLEKNHKEAIVTLAYQDKNGIFQNIAGGALVHPNIIISHADFWRTNNHDYFYNTINIIKPGSQAIQNFNKKTMSFPISVIIHSKHQQQTMILKADAYIRQAVFSKRYKINPNDGSPIYIKNNYIIIVKIKDSKKTKDITPISLLQPSDAQKMRQSPLFFYTGMSYKPSSNDNHHLSNHDCDSKLSHPIIQPAFFLDKNVYQYIFPYVSYYPGKLETQFFENKTPLDIKFPYITRNSININLKSKNPKYIWSFIDLSKCLFSMSCIRIQKSQTNTCSKNPGYPIIIKYLSNELKIIGFKIDGYTNTIEYSDILEFRNHYKGVLQDFKILPQQQIDLIFEPYKTDIFAHNTEQHKSYIVSLFSKNHPITQSPSSFCRGALIHQGVVLTAAHCLNDMSSTKNLYVSFFIKRQQYNAKITHFIIHPRYLRTNKAQKDSYKNSWNNFDHDIALIFFQTPKSMPSVDPVERVADQDHFIKNVLGHSSEITVLSSIGKTDIMNTIWPNIYKPYALLQAKYNRDVDKEIKRAQQKLTSLPYQHQKDIFFHYIKHITGEEVLNNSLFYQKLRAALKKYHAYFNAYCNPKYFICLEIDNRYDMWLRNLLVCRGDSGFPVLWTYEGKTRLVSIGSTLSSAFGYNNSTCSAGLRSIVIAPYNQWIDAHITNFYGKNLRN